MEKVRLYPSYVSLNPQTFSYHNTIFFLSTDSFSWAFFFFLIFSHKYCPPDNTVIAGFSWGHKSSEPGTMIPSSQAEGVGGVGGWFGDLSGLEGWWARKEAGAKWLPSRLVSIKAKISMWSASWCDTRQATVQTAVTQTLVTRLNSHFQMGSQDEHTGPWRGY